MEDKDGNTQLHFAATNDKTVKRIKEFISEGLDINAQNKKGNTPLHIAYQNNASEVVAELLCAGANLSLRNLEGKAPSDLSNEPIK